MMVLYIVVGLVVGVAVLVGLRRLPRQGVYFLVCGGLLAGSMFRLQAQEPGTPRFWFHLAVIVVVIAALLSKRWLFSWRT